MRNKTLTCLAIALTLPAAAAHASDVGFNVGINIGNQPRAAAPVYVPQPPPPPVYGTPVVIEEPPEFIEPPELGFYVAVGIPYDLFFLSNRYYLRRGDAWYSGPRYNGPWVSVHYRMLPTELRRYPYKRIRHFRDEGFRDYRRSGNPYWEKHRFHPKKEWKEERKAERREWKEERKAAHEQWKREKHREKEREKDARRHGHEY